VGLAVVSFPATDFPAIAFRLTGAAYLILLSGRTGWNGDRPL
jgi:hypothetical protein